MGLKNQAVKGVAWTSVGTIGSGLLNLLVTIVLARLLTPHDFGIIELLVVFSSLSDIIVDSGFSQAVIKDNDATDTDLSSVFWLNLSIAIVLYLILFFVSPYIARFYNAPIMENLSKVVFLTIVFNSLSVIQNANLSRNLAFRPFALASIISIVISGSIAVFLALHGYGVWALAFNLVGFSFFRMSILWLLSGWHPKFKFSYTSIKRYFSFGVNLLVQGLLDKLVTNLESLIIGKVYTKQQLGYFSQGRKLDSYVTQATNNVVLKVSYPVLSKIKNNETSLKEGYRTIVGVTMCCISPIMAIMFFGADYIMNGIFGSQWLPSTPYLRLWSICGWCLIVYSIFINIFLVKGKSKQLLRCSIVKQIMRIIVIICLVRISIMHMMVGIVAVTFLAGMIYIYFGGKLIEYTIWEFLKDISITFVSVLIAGASAFFVTPMIVVSNGIYALIVLTAILGVVYLLLLLLFKSPYLQTIFSIIKK
ncbi:MAG: lipopolysaccharide biosynthesis protein [Bacteroidales bacterium]|nr:lipopolysaccharide biosynthesis protein [Bacteroidales bacterium]